MLVKDQDGNPIDFSGAASVTFLMYNSQGTQIVSAPGSIEAPLSSGVLRYAWAEGDTEEAGEFRAEFDVSYGAGGMLTIPAKGTVLVRIYEDLNDA
jgi:hypothetical protein